MGSSRILCSIRYFILVLNEKITEGLGHGERALDIFLSASQAFDTVDHDIAVFN